MERQTDDPELEKDILRLSNQQNTHREHWEALIEEMRGKYGGFLDNGPATFEPNIGLRYILMEIVRFDQRKKLMG